MSKAILNVLHLLPGCEKAFSQPLEELNGVGKGNVQIFYGKDEVHVTFDEQLVSTKEIEELIKSYGYPVADLKVTTNV